MQKRQTELTKLFKRLYEDSVLGRIPDEQYRILSQEYTVEQKEIQEQLSAMEARLQELKYSSSNIARFIENAKRYTEIPELTSEILRIFIKRVRGWRKGGEILPHSVAGSSHLLPRHRVSGRTASEHGRSCGGRDLQRGCINKKGGCAETQPPSTGTNINLCG